MKKLIFVFMCVIFNVLNLIAENEVITSKLPILETDQRGYKLTPEVVYNSTTGNYETVYYKADSNGNVYMVLSGTGNVKTTNDFFLDITRGEADGFESLFVVGVNTAASTSEEVLWDGGEDYTFLDKAEALYVVSDSTDDHIMGLGARTLVLSGLDSNYDEFTEVVILNGTNTVTTTNSFLRTTSAIILTDGNQSTIDGGNYGNITFTSTSTAILQAQILPFNGRTLMAKFTVPNGKTAYAVENSFNVGQGKQCLFKIKLKSCITANCSFATQYLIYVYQNTFSTPITLPLRVPEKTDGVVTTIVGDAPDVTVSATFNLILEEN